MRQEMGTYSFRREVMTWRAVWLAAKTVPFWAPPLVIALRPGELGVLPGPWWAYWLPVVFVVWNIGVVWVDAVRFLRWTLMDHAPVGPPRQRRGGRRVRVASGLVAQRVDTPTWDLPVYAHP